MVNQHASLKSTLAIILACFLWGTTGTVASFSPHLSTLAIGAFSMGVGGLLLVLVTRRKLLKDYQLIRAQPLFILLGAACVAIYPLAFYTSMRLSGVAIGTVISIASAPLFAALLERLISKKKISRQWISSFIIGAIGTVLLVVGRDKSNLIIEQQHYQYVGIILGGIAGLTYAGYSWAARGLIENGVDSQSSMSAMFGCASLLLLPSLWFTGQQLFTSTVNTLVPLYIAIIPMFLGYLLFAFGLQAIDASKATLITLIEPVIATVLAVFIIGEKFTAVGWGGIALVSLCLFLQSFYRQPSREVEYIPTAING